LSSLNRVDAILKLSGNRIKESLYEEAIRAPGV
jgi:hypothetical protein